MKGDKMIDWKGQRVVVTGGAGFIGSHLVDILVERGAHVIVVDDLRRGHFSNIARHDIMRSTGVPGHGAVWFVDWSTETYFRATRARDTIVFHLAATVTNIRENMGAHLHMLQENLDTNTSIINAVMRGGIKLLVATSTVCVYPHDAPTPTPESAAWPLHPEETNEGYGLAKGILEKQAEFLCREYRVPTVVTRFSNAIGLRDYYDWGSSHVVPAMIRKAHENDVVEVWGTGEQTRVFIDARDLAYALVRLAETPEAHDAQPVNIGHETEISIGDLVFKILDLCGKIDKGVVFDPSQPDGHKRRAVDNSRLRSLIGWVPDRPLEETLADMIEEFRSGNAHL